MGGPGSEDLLERRDGQIQVRPRPGWWRPPNVEGEVGGSWTGEVLVLLEGVPSTSSPGRSQPSLGRDAAAPSQGPEEGQERLAGQSAYAGESPQNQPLSTCLPMLPAWTRGETESGTHWRGPERWSDLPEATQEGWSRDLNLSSSDARTTIGPGHYCSCSWPQARHPWGLV